MNIKQMIEEEVRIHNANMYHIFRSSDYHKEVVIENERFISAISNAIQERVEGLDRYHVGHGMEEFVDKKGQWFDAYELLSLFKGE